MHTQAHTHITLHTQKHLKNYFDSVISCHDTPTQTGTQILKKCLKKKKILKLLKILPDHTAAIEDHKRKEGERGRER